MKNLEDYLPDNNGNLSNETQVFTPRDITALTNFLNDDDIPIPDCLIFNSEIEIKLRKQKIKEIYELLNEIHGLRKTVAAPPPVHNLIFYILNEDKKLKLFCIPPTEQPQSTNTLKVSFLLNRDKQELEEDINTNINISALNLKKKQKKCLVTFDTKERSEEYTNVQGKSGGYLSTKKTKKNKNKIQSGGLKIENITNNNIRPSTKSYFNNIRRQAETNNLLNFFNALTENDILKFKPIKKRRFPALTKSYTNPFIETYEQIVEKIYEKREPSITNKIPEDPDYDTPETHTEIHYDTQLSGLIHKLIYVICENKDKNIFLHCVLPSEIKSGFTFKEFKNYILHTSAHPFYVAINRIRGKKMVEQLKEKNIERIDDQLPLFFRVVDKRDAEQLYNVAIHNTLIHEEIKLIIKKIQELFEKKPEFQKRFKINFTEFTQEDYNLLRDFIASNVDKSNLSTFKAYLENTESETPDYNEADYGFGNLEFEEEKNLLETILNEFNNEQIKKIVTEILKRDGDPQIEQINNKLETYIRDNLDTTFISFYRYLTSSSGTNKIANENHAKNQEFSDSIIAFLKEEATLELDRTYNQSNASIFTNKNNFPRAERGPPPAYPTVPGFHEHTSGGSRVKRRTMKKQKGGRVHKKRTIKKNKKRATKKKQTHSKKRRLTRKLK